MHPKKSKLFIFTLIAVAFIGIPLTLLVLQNQAVFRQFAWSTQQSAVAVCSPSNGTVVIKVTFANTESAKNMVVTASDIQTGASVDLGTIMHQQQKSADIVTNKSSIGSGSALFKLVSADNVLDTTQLVASYSAILNCSPPQVNFCASGNPNNQGFCRWDVLPGAQGYNVNITDIDTNTIVQSLTLPKDASQSAFPMVPGKQYQCTVTPTNECKEGTPVTSPIKICTPQPTPTPTPPACINNKPVSGVCRWDSLDGAISYNITVTDQTSGQATQYTVQAPTTQVTFPDNGVDTYVCSVAAANVCGIAPPSSSPPSSCTVPITPTITPTPTPTLTPAPTSTPTLQPTSTPIVTIPQPTQVPATVQPVQTVVQQSVPQSQPKTFTTPVPTLQPTGDATSTMLFVGVSTILVLAGGLLVFIL